MRFDNRYCWTVYPRGETVVRVRAYLDFGNGRQALRERRDSLIGGNRLRRF
jgi:hypothetical protein